MPVALVGPSYVSGLPSRDTGGTRILCAVKHTSKPEFLWGQNTFCYALVFCKIPFFQFAFVTAIQVCLCHYHNPKTALYTEKFIGVFLCTSFCVYLHHFPLPSFCFVTKKLAKFFLPFLPPGPLDAVLRKSWRSSR